MHYPFCIYYHPTTVMFIDDNEDFMKQMTLSLKKEFSFQTFSEPVKALQYFQEIYQPSAFLQRCSVRLDPRAIEDFQRDHLVFSELDLKLCRKEILRSDRFKEIAVLIVDYAMPRMNGLALSKALKKAFPQLQIILLTGEADEHLAIQAFNEGIIDQYIKKSTPELTSLLLTAIQKLEQAYFIDLSKSIIEKAADLSNNNKLARLNDPNLMTVFNQLIEEHKIVEYYLLDETGSFLLVDKQGNPYWFAVLDEAEMQVLAAHVAPEELTQAELAELEETLEVLGEELPPEVPSFITHALQNKEKILFFFTDEVQLPKIDEWGPYLHPATQIQGEKNTYYYALISQPSIYDWPADKILSYENYLKNLN